MIVVGMRGIKKGGAVAGGEYRERRLWLVIREKLGGRCLKWREGGACE